MAKWWTEIFTWNLVWCVASIVWWMPDAMFFPKKQQQQLESLITMRLSHSFSRPAEQTAGCVRWSALSKSLLTAVVQPEEDNPQPFTFKSCKTSVNLLDERGYYPLARLLAFALLQTRMLRCSQYYEYTGYQLNVHQNAFWTRMWKIDFYQCNYSPIYQIMYF